MLGLRVRNTDSVMELPVMLVAGKGPERAVPEEGHRGSVEVLPVEQIVQEAVRCQQLFLD